MRISIVTSCFNQARYVATAMESVLGQGYSDLDYILVDPGSTDGSREIIRAWSRQITMVFEKDSGAAEGLNRGFTRSSGEVLGFLNADDVLLPGALQKVARFFAERSDCDLVAGDGWIIDACGTPLQQVKARRLSVMSYLLGQRQWLQQAIFFRRDLYWDSGGFNNSNRTCWDGELFARMLKRGANVGYIHGDLAAFRIHPASLTGAKSNGSAYREDCRRIFRDLTARDWTPFDTALAWSLRVETACRRILDHLRIPRRESLP